MKRITDFKWEVDKERIFRIIDCSWESPAFQQVDILYQKSMEEITNILKPLGVYNFVDFSESMGFSDIQGCEKIVYFLLTLGNGIDKKINSYFAQGKYMEALLMDTIANEILFKCTEELYNKVSLEVRAYGWGLTRRFEPGSGDVPLDFQKEILAGLDLKDLKISLTEKNMLTPLKTITFFCGAGENVKPALKGGYACDLCSRKDCKFRHEK